MKVLGQLEGAQLEQNVGNPTPTPTGRVFADITNPLAAVPMFYNGTGWKQLIQQGVSLVSQNSGKACTVDWSTGVQQRVVLTDNAIISFANPQAGQVHTLIVSQAAKNSTNANYLYKLNMIDQDPAGKNYQPRRWMPMGESETWNWYYQAGVKAAYATVPQVVSTKNTVADPAGTPTCGDIAPGGETIWLGHASSAFGSELQVYMGREKPVLQTLFANAAWAAALVGVSYTPDGNFAFGVSGTSPFIEGRFTHAGFQGGPGEGAVLITSWANPGTLPAGAGKCVAAHPSSAFVACGHTTTPFMSCYPINTGGTFGTKITNPGTLPAAQVNGIAWSPVGDFLTVGSQTTPFIQTYPFTFAGGTGSFGSVVANPGTLPADGPAGAGSKQIAWRPQGDFIAMLTNTSPWLYVVPFNRSTAAYGTALTINYTPPAKPITLSWSPDGQYIVMGTTSSPYIICLDFSALTIPATAATLDSTGIGQAIAEVAIHPSGEWAACVLTATPYVATISLPNKIRNYLRLA